MKRLPFEKDPPRVLPATVLATSSRDGVMSPKEFAIHTKVNLRTVRRWLKKGYIEYFQPAGPGSTVLIPINNLSKDPPDKQTK